jgi:tRNA nucleotidyltransferase (CCA-adding enzyme)
MIKFNFLVHSYYNYNHYTGDTPKFEKLIHLNIRQFKQINCHLKKKLSRNEIEIFKIIDNTLKSNGLKGKVTVMAAGSWVRDKLLNKPNTKINLVFQTKIKDLVNSDFLA